MTPLPPSRPRTVRWHPQAYAFMGALGLVLLLLALGPWLFPPGALERLVALYVYVTLAMSWNLLAGFGGLVSVGQQAFFGLGAYVAIRLSAGGLAPYPALALAAFAVALIALPIGEAMLHLEGGAFAIGMWVVAELAHLLVNLDPLVQGETGISLIALEAVPAALRRMATYWFALAGMTGFGLLVFLLLRGPAGLALQAIRDDAGAAESIGVRVFHVKRLVFALAALGGAFAGAAWLASAITFQPHAYFSVQWTAYMIFMSLVGGLGTFEGPLLGAVLFFLIETFFGGSGVWYLIGLGAAALLFALFVPEGLVGGLERRFTLRLLPVGYRVILPASSTRQGESLP
jgi:branched-chain amino acid transport system permease protein